MAQVNVEPQKKQFGEELHFHLSSTSHFTIPANLVPIPETNSFSTRQILHLGKYFIRKLYPFSISLPAAELLDDMEAGKLRFRLVDRMVGGIAQRIEFSNFSPWPIVNEEQPQQDKADLFATTSISVVAIQGLIWEYCFDKQAHDANLDTLWNCNMGQFVIRAQPIMYVWCPDLSRARYAIHRCKYEVSNTEGVTFYPAHRYSFSSLSHHDLLIDITADIIEQANNWNWRDVKVVAPTIVKWILSYARPIRDFEEMFLYNTLLCNLDFETHGPNCKCSENKIEIRVISFWFYCGATAKNINIALFRVEWKALCHEWCEMNQIAYQGQDSDESLLMPLFTRFSTQTNNESEHCCESCIARFRKTRYQSKTKIKDRRMGPIVPCFAKKSCRSLQVIMRQLQDGNYMSNGH